jgi:hypothetical protein
MIGAAHQWRAGENFKGVIQIGTPRPYLSFMNITDAFAQAFNPFVLGKNPPRACAKALQDFLRIGRIEQDDTLDLGPERAHLAQHLGTVTRLVVQIVTDNHNIDRHTGDGGQQFFGI